MSEVANPASALGEAIGHLIEEQVYKIVEEVAKKHGCKVVRKGEGKQKKLVMTDKWGNKFDIDMVVKDQFNQPISLIESKYLRYKKHMRDKGSWVVVAHSNLRRTLSTIRSCIAVLIGDWTKGSKHLLQSHGITLLEIPFNDIADTLQKYEINYRWAEKDRDTAIEAWKRFNKLGNEEKERMREELVRSVATNLKQTLETIIYAADKTPEVQTIEVTLRASTGEHYVFEFNDLKSTIEFLTQFDITKVKEKAKKEREKGTLISYF